MNETNETVWMAAKEVMEVLECSKGYVLRQANKGVIRRRETSAHKRYLRADVEKLAAAQQAQTA